MLVAGVDGCPGGWAVATASTTGRALTGRALSGRALAGRALSGLSVERVESLDDLVASVRTGAVGALAVDMPIGLLDTHPRTADGHARTLLGPRRSSVFPTPLRVTLDAADYEAAKTRSLDACGKALSKQAWNLMPKIRELDTLIHASDQPAVAEAHPECAFLRLQADIPLDHPKSTEAGRALRVGLLRASGCFDAVELDRALASSEAPVVDLIDAIALTLTAGHMASGTERRLGDQQDHLGRRAEIVY